LNFGGKETYFNLLKIIRLRKGIEKLNVNELMYVIKEYHSKHLEKMHSSTSHYEEILEDMCKIKEKYVLKNFL
jgi:hypothetical protein